MLEWLHLVMRRVGSCPPACSGPGCLCAVNNIANWSLFDCIHMALALPSPSAKHHVVSVQGSQKTTTAFHPSSSSSSGSRNVEDAIISSLPVRAAATDSAGRWLVLRMDLCV